MHTYTSASTISVSPGRTPKWRIVAGAIYSNRRIQAQLRAGNAEGHSGATHRDWTTDQSLAYIDTVFQEYLEYGGLSIDGLRGKSILEIGPGDNLGVALTFLAAGAHRVVCLDKC